MGGTTLTVPGRLAGRIQQCYPVGGRPSLVQLTLHRRLVTMLGTGVLLNDEMDDFAAKPNTPNVFGLVTGESNSVAPGKIPRNPVTFPVP